jgi:hypothetical protein
MLKDYSNIPILITGAARSGTSMVAACFHLCGAWKGDTGGPNRHNEKGMFENLPLRQNVVKPYFKASGFDALGQYPLPPTNALKIPFNFREQVLKEITKQGWQSEKPWMYKCAKMSLIWPAWAYAFPNSKWIIVRRKREDIVYSCTKTSFMQAYNKPWVLAELGFKTAEEGWNYWVEFHENKFQEIINQGINAKIIWPQKLIQADYSELKEAIEWVGLPWNGSAVTDFIEPRLWKARR